MRPLRKARWVNSPGSAARAPASMSHSRRRCRMKVEPWQDSSTVSSPVNECGARKTVATASSSSSPLRTRRPKVAVCERRSASGAPERGIKKRSQSVTASGPETRTMANAPLPAGVDKAQMVEESVVIGYALEDTCRRTCRGWCKTGRRCIACCPPRI